MWLAGIPVQEAAVVELISRLYAAELDVHADHLQRTLDRGARIVALDEPDRHAILRVLEDCPDQLLELRATLVQEAAWRQREGLCLGSLVALARRRAVPRSASLRRGLASLA